MSLTLYDKAVTEKIKHWVLDPNMTVLSPDETREMISWKADISEDKPIQLPLITINRNRDATFRETGKKAMTFQGKVFNSSKGVSDHLNAIPINISYVINIYTRYLEEADEYARNFAFNFINYPQIIFKIPYNDSNLTYSSFITLLDTLSDNSDIPERLVQGQFSRLTLSIALNDAYLFSYNRRNIPHIVGTDISIIIKKEDTDKNSSTGSVDSVIDTDEFDIEIII